MTNMHSPGLVRHSSQSVALQFEAVVFPGVGGVVDVSVPEVTEGEAVGSLGKAAAKLSKLKFKIIIFLPIV